MKIKQKDQMYTDVGCAKLDSSRWERQRIPEAVFCRGKSLEQIKKIVRGMMDSSTGPVLLTRADRKIYLLVRKSYPKAQWYPAGRMVVIRPCSIYRSDTCIAVVSAGTADIPVAEEACITIESLGLKVERVFDVGVAGVHRLLQHRAILDKSTCIIVCAGMEGALPSVVGGLVSVPVIAVPTSVGYGVSLNGIAPLLTMLNTCTPNVTVVNIDNGFGAGIVSYLVSKNNTKMKHKN